MPWNYFDNNADCFDIVDIRGFEVIILHIIFSLGWLGSLFELLRQTWSRHFLAEVSQARMEKSFAPSAGTLASWLSRSNVALLASPSLAPAISSLVSESPRLNPSHSRQSRRFAFDPRIYQRLLKNGLSVLERIIKGTAGEVFL
jgi:hypothetical protein